MELRIRDEAKLSYGDGKQDAAFRKVNLNSVGFYIWRVENDRVETISRDNYGQFCDNGTYIIYAASQKGCYVNHETINRIIKTPSSANLDRFIHLWIGDNTTNEQSGSAVYKLIELDIYLGNTSTEYRETQGNESARFLSYFKSGFSITSSYAMKQTTKIKLFHVKGKRSPECIQKETIDWSHFTSNNVMILLTENFIYEWVGRSTTLSERLHGLNIATKLRNDSFDDNVREIVIIDDGYEQSMENVKKSEWNAYLNLNERFVQPTLLTVQPQVDLVKLYKCGYANSKYRVEEMKIIGLEQVDISNTDFSYIIDRGLCGVWIWVPKASQLQDKAEAIRNARGFVKKKKYPISTPIIRVIEDYEPNEFINLFPSWRDADNNTSSVINLTSKIDTMTLLQRPKLAAQLQLLDDASGVVRLYRIETNKNVTELPSQKGVAFYSNDCYIVQYVIPCAESSYPATVVSNSQVQNIIYLWIGRHCKAEDKANGDDLFTSMCSRLGKYTIQVKINEGSEPPHFLQLFQGMLIIFRDGYEYNRSGTVFQHHQHFVLKVTGNATYNTKAQQVSNKNIYTPHDCYILKTKDEAIWVWCGQCSTGDARESAKSIGSLLGEYTLVLESKEPDKFWSSISIKIAEKLKRDFDSKQISSVTFSPPPLDKYRVSLYICSLEQGNIRLQKMVGFEQKDLMPEDIALLDTGFMIYIWIGALCLEEEKKFIWKFSNNLIRTQFVMRDLNSPITVIAQDYEPNTFTGFFDAWNVHYWESHQSFDKRRKFMTSGSVPKISLSNTDINGNGYSHLNGFNFDNYDKYPIDMLRGEVCSLPADVDPKRKEIHLTHDDFVSIFQMKFIEFESLPNWKKQELKKKYKLF